jgi:hypothetical protein
MIQQPPWSSNENINSGAHRVLLRRHAYAAINRGGGNGRVNSHGIERGENLRRQFSRGRNDERASFPARLADQMVKNWQNKSGGLSASGHRARKNVAPLQCGRDCLSLNWCWSLEAQLFEALMEAGVKL